MEQQIESRSLQKYEINGTGEPTADNEFSLRSKNKKGLVANKSQQSDISGLNEHQRRLTEDISPYATSYPLANRLYALKNPRKYQPGMIGDRVMSAKLIKMKELESELTVIRKQLNEVNGENKLLRALQHRQDHALKKFEGTKGQLPQLIQSHSEEVRALKTKCKKISMQNRDLEKRLRNREMELRGIQEQNRHLQQLSKDRNLGERESLREEVETLKNVLQHMEMQLQDIVRRKAIEQRINQQRLQQEMNLNKELKKSLLSAEENNHELKALLLENEIHFDPEKNQNSSKSSKEIKKVGTSSQRLPLICQQHQQEAVEVFKESNLSSVKKLTDIRPKPCPSMMFKSIKSGVLTKDTLTIGEKKSNQHVHGHGDERETENASLGRLSLDMKIIPQESCFKSDDFYLSLDANTYLRSNDAEDLRENAAKSPVRGVKDSSRGRETDSLSEVSPKSLNVIELETDDVSRDESTSEGSSSPSPETIKDLTKKELLPSDMTDDALSCDAVSVTFSNEGSSEHEIRGVHQEKVTNRSKKEKLLKALRAIDQEDWTDIETSDDVETEQELSIVNIQVKSARKTSHSFGKGKLSSDRSCSSGPNSAKSKKSPILRNSAKPDLMHELFGTIPKSEMKMNKKKTSDPTIPMIRDIKS